MNFLNLFAACQKELSLDWRQYLALKCAWNTGGRKVTLLEGVRRKQGRRKPDTLQERKTKQQKWGVTSNPWEEKAALLHDLCCSLVYECWWNPEPEERWLYIETSRLRFCSLFWKFVLPLFTCVNICLAGFPLTRRSAEDT